MVIYIQNKRKGQNKTPESKEEIKMITMIIGICATIVFAACAAYASHEIVNNRVK